MVWWSSWGSYRQPEATYHTDAECCHVDSEASDLNHLPRSQVPPEATECEYCSEGEVDLSGGSAKVACPWCGDEHQLAIHLPCDGGQADD
jgi:hypothetical protein